MNGLLRFLTVVALLLAISWWQPTDYMIASSHRDSPVAFSDKLAFQIGNSNPDNPTALPDPTLAAVREYSATVRKAVANASAATRGMLLASTTFPAVGRLLRVSPQAGVASCTGTLVSPIHFLTAAHCFCENADGYFQNSTACLNANAPAARTSYVYFPAAGLFPVKSVSLNPK